ncbi:hypothetical protein [Streptomyces sp. DSM 41013]
MATDETRNINVDIEALGQSRVYQVAEGSMFIGDVDATAATARRLATVPVQEAVNKLLDMSSAERAAVLAAMPAPAAAYRLSGMPPLIAIEVLNEIDEQLAIERILAMEPFKARSLVLVTPEPFRSNLLEKMTLQQTCHLLGDVDEREGQVSLDVDVLKQFAVCLPLNMLSVLLAQVPPEIGSQVLEAATGRDVPIWLSMEEQARLALVGHMPIELLEKVIHLTASPSEEVQQLCSLAGRNVPQLGEIVGHLTWDRLAEFATTTGLGASIYPALPPELRVTLIRYLDVSGLASILSRLREDLAVLAECVSTMMEADVSRPFRSPLAYRYVAAALANSSVDTDGLMSRLPQNHAAALWASHWAYGAAQEISKIDNSNPYSEAARDAYEKFAKVADSHKEEVAWHFSYDFCRYMADHLESKRWNNSKRERDLKILTNSYRHRRAPDPLV